MKYVNCGCGTKYVIDPLWINLDFIPTQGVQVCNIINGLPFSENEVDLVYSCHMLEHFTVEQAKSFMKECYRVLKPEGIIRIVVPDLENICREYLKMLELVRDHDEYEKKYQYIVIELLDQMTRMSSGGELKKYWESDDGDEEYVRYRTGELKRKQNKVKKNFIKRVCMGIKRILMRFKVYREVELGKFMLKGELHKWMYDSYSLVKLMENAGFSECKVMKCDESKIVNWKDWKLELREDGTEYKPHALYVEAIKREG